MITRLLGYWLAASALLSPLATAEANNVIHFSCWLPPSSPIYMKLENIYRASFAALGFDFEMTYQPMQRSIQDANAGVSDGECARAYNYLSSAPESCLLRVDVVVASANLQVWSNNPAVEIANLTELNASSLRIGYRLGSTVKPLFTPERFVQTKALVSSAIGLKMLSAGRIDLLLIHEAAAKNLIVTLQLPNPVYNAGTVIHQEAYVHLHPRHRELLSGFTAELRKRLPEDGMSLSNPAQQ